MPVLLYFCINEMFSGKFPSVGGKTLIKAVLLLWFSKLLDKDVYFGAVFTFLGFEGRVLVLIAPINCLPFTCYLSRVMKQLVLHM